MLSPKDKQAGPTFCSLSTLGITLSCSWLQISVSIAKSQRETSSEAAMMKEGTPITASDQSTCH